jgi:general secretion pathway protein A
VAGSGEAAPVVRFSPAAILAIHLLSGGSPRKIVRLCHMAMLEMLVRGKTCVGLLETRTAVRPGDGPSLRRRRAMALAASAVLCLGLGSLWLTADPAGPVLGSRVQSERVSDRLAEVPAAATNAKAEAPLEVSVETVVARAETQAVKPPQARPEGGSAVLAPEGLTLLPERGEAPPAPTGLTLLPPRDQGPAVRSPIGRSPIGRGLDAHGTLGEAAPARVQLAEPLNGERATPATSRTVAFSAVGR